MSSLDDAPHGEGLARPAALAADHRAAEDLNPFLVALPDPHPHIHRVPDGEFGTIGPQVLVFEVVQAAHVVLPKAGSACAERSRKPSPVLTAIGADEDFGTIRFSFGRDTTPAEVETAAELLVNAVNDFK